MAYTRISAAGGTFNFAIYVRCSESDAVSSFLNSKLK
jgi:hypothetical protein